MFWINSRKKPSKGNVKANPLGYALTVGLNKVDAYSYGGWSGPLNACENDARHLARMLSEKGYNTTTVLTKSATSENVLDWLETTSRVAKAGDIVVVTSSSHGGQTPDTDGNEADGLDETICLYDRQLIDDELDAAWAMFCPGVRLFFVSDSCHSGTVARAIGTPSAHVTLLDGSRAMPPDIAARDYRDRANTYRTAKDAARSRKPIVANLLAFGACQDNQTAMDGPVNGAFTGALLTAIRLAPTDNPVRTIKRVRGSLPPSQSPSYVYGGPRDAVYEAAPTFARSLVP